MKEGNRVLCWRAKHCTASRILAYNNKFVTQCNINKFIPPCPVTVFDILPKKYLTGEFFEQVKHIHFLRKKAI